VASTEGAFCEKEQKAKKKCRNLWPFGKKVVPLQPQIAK